MRSQPTNRRIGSLADRQHGVASRIQLLVIGLSVQAIDRAVAAGRLRPLFRGVYAVGHVALRREGWWKAALLACGDDAVLSHASATTLLGLGRYPILPVELIASGQRGRQQANLSPHRMQLDRSEVMTIGGLRVTAPARTIADTAARLRPRGRRELVERAQDLERFHPDEIRAVLLRRPRRPGARALLDLLELMAPDADSARSHLERLFLAIVRGARLPGPHVNVPLGPLTPDFTWPDRRLAVEVDGYRYHSSREAQRRDRRRDRGLTARGWRPVRFTYEEITFEPGRVAAELAELLREPAFAEGRRGKTCAPDLDW